MNSGELRRFRLSVFVAVFKGNGSSPAELLLTAPDSQRVGYDPAARTYLAEVPRAVYDSAPAYADDDLPSASDQAPGPISNRAITLTPHLGGRYLLSVTGVARGSYVLQVTLSGVPGVRSVRKEARDVHLERGEVHRYSVQVDSGTVLLERVR